MGSPTAPTSEDPQLSHSAVRPPNVFPRMSTTVGHAEEPHHCTRSGASAPSVARTGQRRAQRTQGGGRQQASLRALY